MRRLLLIMLLMALPVIARAQTSPTLNTLTGPYRGPTTWVTPKTLKDSIDALEARLHLVIVDTTAATNDSIALIRVSVADLLARYLADSVRTAAHIDTLHCVWVTVNDTTSPGTFYAPDTAAGRFVRADSSLLRRARIVGVVVDSVNKGAKARIQTAGTVSFSWWNGLLGPVGSTVVNDSITACNPAPSDATRTNTLPMQALGFVVDSITVRLHLGEVWYYEN